MLKRIRGWLRWMLRRARKAPIANTPEWDLVPFQFAINWYAPSTDSQSALVAHSAASYRRKSLRVFTLANGVVSAREGL